MFFDSNQSLNLVDKQVSSFYANVYPDTLIIYCRNQMTEDAQ